MTVTTSPNIIADNVLLGRTSYGERVYVMVEVSEHAGPHTTIYHQPVDGCTRISISGETVEKGRRVASTGGQIIGTLRDIEKFAPGWSRTKLVTLERLWKDHHLNDMRAGCAHQTRVGYGTEALDQTPPCPETGYKYGHAWLVDLDDTTQDAIRQLRDLFSGQK